MDVPREVPVADTRWRIKGDYFENCNCDIVCPCLFSTAPLLTSQPTEGACEVGFGFHVDRGNFGEVALDGFNVAVLARTPGPMAEGNWTVALYVDERADGPQREALTAIFSGAAGGTMGNLAPLISTVLGVVSAPIHWQAEDRRRSIEIPGRMAMGVVAVPGAVLNEAIWARNAHPFASEVAMAVGTEGSTWVDYGMRWDNSGKNGHYAPIDWTNA
jgi:hypothetical protein